MPPTAIAAPPLSSNLSHPATPRAFAAPLPAGGHRWAPASGPSARWRGTTRPGWPPTRSPPAAPRQPTHTTAPSACSDGQPASTPPPPTAPRPRPARRRFATGAGPATAPHNTHSGRSPPEPGARSSGGQSLLDIAPWSGPPAPPRRNRTAPARAHDTARCSAPAGIADSAARIEPPLCGRCAGDAPLVGGGKKAPPSGAPHGERLPIAVPTLALAAAAARSGPANVDCRALAVASLAASAPTPLCG